VCLLLLAASALAREPQRQPAPAQQLTMQLDSRGHVIGRTRPDGHGGWRAYDPQGHMTGQFRRGSDGSVHAYDERGHYLGRTTRVGPPRRD
jgi:YD repeat-containing protein